MTEYPDHPEIAPGGQEDFDRLAARTDLVHFAVHMDRPGGTLFGIKLEHEHFPPRTPSNTLLEMRLVRWPVDIGWTWAIISIPKQYLPIAEQVATECELQLGEPGQTTICYGGGKEDRFPFFADSLYTLTNLPNSLVYENEAFVNQALQEDERFKIEQILNEDKRKHREELREQGYDDERIDQLFATLYRS